MSQTSTDLTADHPSVAGLSETDRHRLLAAERRRLALTVLAERPPSVDLAELAAEVAAREPGIDATDAEAVEHVAITLHHTHLPTLAEKGVIDYDLRTQRIEPTW